MRQEVVVDVQIPPMVAQDPEKAVEPSTDGDGLLSVSTEDSEMVRFSRRLLLGDWFLDAE
ncbi:hypothetical protein GP486_005866 [Trichoglossum hirsutum]|uniref:Uncharacterized protein n=1 Tax=Trichoglossum hirsutum TaxID=265104 RepID=A0A9P8RLG2_9PEZI|nr:hypothetical protein GP486_005866 [Trichoglossum hirsutum]